MNKKNSVAILGATGAVGQKFIYLLKDHPWFEVTELLASSKSAGKKYRDACDWKQIGSIPDTVQNLIIKAPEEDLNSRILFSGMDSSVAGSLENAYAEAGHTVVSNARNHRMDRDVPLTIPEINPDHFKLIHHQRHKGAIITNANCVAMPLALVLCPLYRKYGIEWVQVNSMQAVSGAGHSGVASMDILGNIIPCIAGEESKVEEESQKILGELDNNSIIPADFIVSAHCNRVPVIDGHTETLSIKFKNRAKISEVSKLLENWQGSKEAQALPSSPQNPIVVFEQDNRPQPRMDLYRGNGMSVCVGRIRECSIGDVKMVIMGHNTIRGAAGAAILNAEALVNLKYLNL